MLRYIKEDLKHNIVWGCRLD